MDFGRGHCKHFKSNLNGIFSKAELKTLNLKDTATKELLHWEESKWRQKRKATWIVQWDENTIFFHNYAKMRNNINTIWIIKD